MSGYYQVLLENQSVRYPRDRSFSQRGYNIPARPLRDSLIRIIGYDHPDRGHGAIQQIEKQLHKLVDVCAWS